MKYSKEIVHVQGVFLKEDVDALKRATNESSIKGALTKAVYFYLAQNPDKK